MTYAQIKDKVDSTIKDDAAKLTATERENFIQEAVKQYSKHRPREVVKEITGAGAYDYAIASNLTAWIKGFSVIRKIEYPADEREPVYLEEDEYMVIEKEAGEYLRFLSDTPPATEKARATYTALHILTDAQNTIPEVDQDALCNLGASLCSQALASGYPQVGDSTINADSANHRTKSQEYQSRAKEQRNT